MSYPASMRASAPVAVLRTIFLAVFTVWSLFPIYWIVSMSFKSPVDTLSIPPKWFFLPTLNAYHEAFTQAPLGALLINSLTIAATATAISLAVGVLAGYSLTLLRLQRAKNYEFWVLSSRMAPPVAVAIPFFLVYRDTHLLDTILGMVLVHIVVVIGVVTWILVETFAGLPRELAEAALVDGCSHLGAFRHIMAPLAVPGVVGAGVISFLLSWNEFFFALILTSDKAKTAPVGLFDYIGFQAINLNALAAAASILLIPAAVTVVGFQKFLVRGLTMGAVKG